MQTPKKPSTPTSAERLEERLDEGLEESFPASDPLSVSGDKKIVRKTAPAQHEKPKDHEK